jgi:phospholipid transport system transporter-binding protein
MANARAVLDEGLAALLGDDMQIDLAQVKEVDSSAVGLLLEWVRAAQRENRRLILVNLPQNLHSLASLYGVLDLLPRGERS